MTPSLRFLIVALIASTLFGCISRPVSGKVFPDRLAEIPPDSRIVATTGEGEELALRVTHATESSIEGVDRHYRKYRLEVEQLTDVRIVAQNDLVVALAFIAVVFVTGI